MPALTPDEQLTFDVAVALKKVKMPGSRKAVIEEGRFEIARRTPLVVGLAVVVSALVVLPLLL